MLPACRRSSVGNASRRGRLCNITNLHQIDEGRTQDGTLFLFFCFFGPSSELFLPIAVGCDEIFLSTLLIVRRWLFVRFTLLVEQGEQPEGILGFLAP